MSRVQESNIALILNIEMLCLLSQTWTIPCKYSSPLFYWHVHPAVNNLAGPKDEYANKSEVNYVGLRSARFGSKGLSTSRRKPRIDLWIFSPS